MPILTTCVGYSKSVTSLNLKAQWYWCKLWKLKLSKCCEKNCDLRSKWTPLSVRILESMQVIHWFLAIFSRLSILYFCKIATAKRYGKTWHKLLRAQTWHNKTLGSMCNSCIFVARRSCFYQFEWRASKTSEGKCAPSAVGVAQKLTRGWRL